MHAHDAISLLIIAMGAFLIPLLSGRIGVPAAVGEILFGILVGTQVLGWVEATEYITFLAEFGFAFLMFLVGLELDFSRIEREGVRGIALALGVTGLIFALSLGVTLALDLPLFLFLAFGAISVGLLLVTVAEAGLSKTPVGQTMIFVGSLGEFITIVLVTGFGLSYEHGFGLVLVWEMAQLVGILLVAYVLLVVLRTLIWWRPEAFARVVAAKDPSEIGVRAGMAMMLIFVALASMIGVEAILGAFVAGALFSFVFREKGILETKMSSIGFGFFVPIFFIWVGMEFDVRSVLRLDILPTLGLFLVAMVVVKVGGSLPLMLRGFRFRETLGTGLLLGAPLTLLVVVARIGEDVGQIDAATSAALVLLAIVTGIFLPWIFGWLMKRGKDEETEDEA